MIRFRTSVFHLHKRFLVSCWGFDERASVPWRPRLSNDASSITIVAWSKYLIARNWNQLRANVTRWLRRNLSVCFKSFSDAGKRAYMRNVGSEGGWHLEERPECLRELHGLNVPRFSRRSSI